MPSPVAHSLIGLSLGAAWLTPARMAIKEMPKIIWGLRRPLVLCIVAANAPDLDFLPGLLTGDLNAFHQGLTHTVPFVLAVAVVLRYVSRTWPKRRVAQWLFLIGASHLAADLLTVDTREPIGIMGLWPFSREYFTAPFSIFMPLQKQSWADLMRPYNWRVVSVELAWCLPLLLAVFAWKIKNSASLLTRRLPNNTE
ncbi:MAG: metal-dependent hydrolase [Kiritimatiellae bacterium]|nr:metal-dependent hydrolase [Kiritimatiellia bacterium]